MQSKNVIAKLEGSDPKLKAEAVMYMAHWDHLERDEGLRGDRVFNGAVDNASGVAGLLELARAYTKLSTRPKRTIIFLSTTAEEPGHFGAKYYVEHPVCALQRTLAVINIDGLNPWGR